MKEKGRRKELHDKNGKHRDKCKETRRNYGKKEENNIRKKRKKAICEYGSKNNEEIRKWKKAKKRQSGNELVG
jgi:hypothetical protein